MDELNESSYMWEEEKERYVLLKEEEGYAIFYVGREDLMFCLIEDDDLHKAIAQKMLENGNSVFDSMESLKEYKKRFEKKEG